MKLPSLSVVVPNYNHAHFLPECLQALAEQSALLHEIVVIDDGSTDNSVEVIQSLAAKYPLIRLFRNDQNRGVVYTANRGIELAQGDYVIFAAADDKLQPGFVEKSLTLLAQHPEAGLSCSATSLYEPSSGLSWCLGTGMADEPRYFSPQELVALEKSKRVFIPSNTIVVRRSAMLEVGGFRPELKWLSDFFIIHVAAFRYGVCYNPEPLGHVNVEAKSYFQSGRNNEAAHRAVLEFMLELLTSPPFAKEGELMGEAGTYYRLEGCIFSVLWRNKRYRRFITWPFLKKHLWYTLQVKLKPYTPTFIGNLYLKLAGYGAKPAPKAE